MTKPPKRRAPKVPAALSGMAATAWLMRRMVSDLIATHAMLTRLVNPPPPPPPDPLDAIEPFDLTTLAWTSDADFARMLATPAKAKGRPRNEAVGTRSGKHSHLGDGAEAAARPGAEDRGDLAGHRTKAKAKPPTWDA